jgi:hypothetical protein
MSHLPKEWRFLRSAWSYAFVLTGGDAAATELVSKALKGVAERNDLVSLRRRRRLLFAMLYREGQKIPRQAGGGDEPVPPLIVLHHLQEPGRSALALLHLRLFDPDQIAVIIDKAEKQIPAILAAAREEFTKTGAPLP